MENFKPKNDSETNFKNTYDTISQFISKGIRSLSVEKRLPYLKAAEPNDTTLMNLYLQALKCEDYETCAVAKELLFERGISIPIV
jgi:succinate dehydrogenase flavin-adding protein (antitoxin of CptAB toxin-antitoxin module)